MVEARGVEPLFRIRRFLLFYGVRKSLYLQGFLITNNIEH